MKLPAILFILIGALDVRSQPIYTVSTLYNFPGTNTGPTGLAVDANGNIYAAGRFLTYPNAPGIAQIIPPTSNGVNGSALVFAGGSLSGFADGTGAEAQFNTPEGMATDAAGNIYVADVGVSSAIVRKIVPPYGLVTTLAGSGGNPHVFGNANGVAMGPSGAVYVSCAGGAVSNLLQYVPGAAPIPVSTGMLMQEGQTSSNFGLYGVAADSSGALYATAVGGGFASGLVNFGQLFVLKINGTPSELSIIAPGTVSQTQPGGQAGLSALNGTVPIAADGAGNVYFGWYGNLFLFNSQTQPIPTVIQYFWGPIVALATDASGRIYVAYGPPGFPFAGAGPGQICVLTPSGITPLGSTAPALTRFTNISARAYVGTGSSVAIAGFVISGANTKQVLIRGVGPTLAEFSVSGVLGQPVLTLFNSSGSAMATNTRWGTNINATQISAAFTAAGAFTLPSGSADSALLLSLAPGTYTAEVSGLNNSTGNALIEVYEVPTP